MEDEIEFSENSTINYIDINITKNYEYIIKKCS